MYQSMRKNVWEKMYQIEKKMYQRQLEKFSSKK